MRALILVAVLLLVAGCATAPKENIPIQSSNLTAGTVSAEVVRGKTTSGELLAMLGAPNIVALDPPVAGAALATGAVANASIMLAARIRRRIVIRPALPRHGKARINAVCQ